MSIYRVVRCCDGFFLPSATLYPLPTQQQMAYDPKFGPEAQTPEQRARVLTQMQRTFPARRCRSPQQQAIYARYVQGELSWEQVCQLLESRSAP